VPWELNPYPNGDDRVTMLVRVTPITATIKAVPIASLTTPGSVSYALDYQKATTETASGDAGFVDVSVPAASAGAQIELRACGPESFDQDARLCTKWQSAGHFVRSPSNLFSPAIVAKIRQIERRLTESAFRRNLAAAATKLTQPGFVLVKTSTGTPKVWFEWKSTLGLTPLSTRDNAWKPPTAPRPPLLTSTYDTAVIPRGTTEEDLVNCGVPVEGADLLLSKLVRVKRGGLLGYGHAVATCLEYGDSVEPWPTAPPSPDDILESSCEMSRVEYEDMVGLLSDPKTDRAVFETNWEHVSDSLRCLQDRGVPVLTGDRSLLQNLQTCGLELLDLPILSSRFTVSEEQQEAINCLRSGSGRPPVYFYFLPSFG
jgi:hypothetical protein